MDLALQFGRPLAELKHSLTERELQRWYGYAERRSLPWQRVELYLAQIAFCVMRGAGAENIELADFLFTVDKPPTEDEPEDDLEETMKALDFKPRKTVTDGS